MKQCPACKTTYTDDSLSFCLSDGATLSWVSDEVETRVIPRADETMRINVPQQTSPVFTPPPVISQQTPQSGGRSKTVGILAGILVLVILLFIGFAAFMLLKPSDDKKANVTSPTVSASPTASKTVNTENENKERNSPTPLPTTTTQNALTTARVNSPNDGFLALRSEPNSETGYQLAKIPHGTTVSVMSCQSNTVRIGSRTGRWCQVNYAGQFGWAFDAWLNY